MPPNHLNPAQRQEVRRRILAGEPIGQVAKEFGIHYITARYHALKPDPLEAAKKRANKARQRAAAKRFLDGENALLLAAEHGVEPVTIRVWAHRYYPNHLPVDIRRFHQVVQRDWMTGPDAAAELGISRFTMHEYLQAGKFPGAFQLGKQGWWLVPRAAVEARKKAKPDA